MPNRRSFLGSLVALAVAPFAPKPRFDINRLWQPTARQVEFLRDSETGISIRFVRRFDPTQAMWISPRDSVYGWAPEWPME